MPLHNPNMTGHNYMLLLFGYSFCSFAHTYGPKINFMLIVSDAGAGSISKSGIYKFLAAHLGYLPFHNSIIAVLKIFFFFLHVIESLQITPSLGQKN